jgi:hypothetical protein
MSGFCFCNPDIFPALRTYDDVKKNTQREAEHEQKERQAP